MTTKGNVQRLSAPKAGIIFAKPQSGKTVSFIGVLQNANPTSIGR